MNIIGCIRWIVFVAVLSLVAPERASAQRRGPSRAGAQESMTMRIGIAAGAAGADVQWRGSPWDFGPLIGARWSWSGTRSGALVALDLQPLPASGSEPAGDYRALWLLPAYEFRAGGARLRAGLGLGFMRFEEERFDGRTEVTLVTGAGGTLPLPGSFALELVWRRTGVVRGFRSSIWSLQLARLWPI